MGKNRILSRSASGSQKTRFNDAKGEVFATRLEKKKKKKTLSTKSTEKKLKRLNAIEGS